MGCLFEKISFSFKDAVDANEFAEVFNKNVYGKNTEDVGIFFKKNGKWYSFEAEDKILFPKKEGNAILMKTVFDFLSGNNISDLYIEYLSEWENCIDVFYNRYEYKNKVLKISSINLKSKINEEECPNCGSFINIRKIEVGKPYICDKCDEKIDYEGNIWICSFKDGVWNIDGDEEYLDYNPNESSDFKG